MVGARLILSEEIATYLGVDRMTVSRPIKQRSLMGNVRPDPDCLAALLLDNMRDALAYFKARPVSNQLTEKEASGFHH